MFQNNKSVDKNLLVNEVLVNKIKNCYYDKDKDNDNDTDNDNDNDNDKDNDNDTDTDKDNDTDTDNDNDTDNDTDNDNEEKKITDTNTIIQNIANEFEVTLPLKKKRGRKSKKEIEMLNKIKEKNIHNDEFIYGESKHVLKYKKRGRKPKGGKIIQNACNNNSETIVKTNVILHLKCFLSDLDINNTNFDKNSCFEGISLENNNSLTYNIIKSNANSNINTLNNNLYCEQYQPVDEVKENNDECFHTNHEQDNYKKINIKDVYAKLKDLEYCLKTNNINNKKSACFYCTCDFDNPPIYIPKHLINGYYHVYGCFCSPECATGFLMKEQTDSSIKYERYFLINNIYSKIYNYEKSIKPAPDPYYTLDKFFGNLTIDEYRSLFKTNRLYILIDKPITRSLPEIHEDNDDFIINNKIIPTNYQSNTSLNILPGFSF